MAYNIGFFKTTYNGFTGKIETLAIKTQVELHRVLDRTNSRAPALELFVGDLRIGAAWEYTGKYGKFYKVRFEVPSFSSGKYFLNRNRGVEDGWTLSFERTARKREETKQAALAKGAVFGSPPSSLATGKASSVSINEDLSILQITFLTA